MRNILFAALLVTTACASNTDTPVADSTTATPAVTDTNKPLAPVTEDAGKIMVSDTAKKEQ